MIGAGSVSVGREELIQREFHFSEQTAGILFVGIATFFFGDAEIAGGDQQLHFPHQANDGEKPHGYIQSAACRSVAEAACKAGADVAGHGGDVSGVTSAGVAGVANVCGKDNGIQYFHGGSGAVTTDFGTVFASLRCVFRGENAGFSFASVENCFFAECCTSFQSLRTSLSLADIKGNTDVEADIHGVKTVVEGERLHIYVGPQNFRTAGLDADGVV